jgi:hypothetical protein
MKLTSLVVSALLAVPMLGTAAAEKVCVPRANGVPGNSGPPDWGNPLDPMDPADVEDDARWRGSAGHSINVGSPTAPLNFRALYSGSGDTRSAWLQWRINIGVAPGAHREFYLGLQSPTDASATYVVRFRFAAGTTNTQGGFVQCNQSDSACVAGGVTNFYTVYKLSATCGVGGSVACECAFATDPIVPVVTAKQFNLLTSGGSPVAVAWPGTAKFWANGDGSWAVGVKVPVKTTAMPADLAHIHENTRFWYEAPINLTGGSDIGSGGSPHHQWPRLDPVGVCSPFGDTFFEIPVDPNAASGFTFGDVDYIDSGETADGLGCTGISIEPGSIGVYGPNGKQNRIWGTVNGSGWRNAFEVVLRNTSTQSAAAVSARFRIADWGIQNYASARWRSIPFDSDGGGALPPSYSMPVAVPAASGTTPGSATLRLGTVSGGTPSAGWILDANDLRDYGLDGGGNQIRDSHQCVLVDLEGQSDADFLQRSTYMNMELGNLTGGGMLREERGFQKSAVVDMGSPLYAFRDVYLYVMNKNMPERLADGATGRAILQANAAALAAELQRDFFPSDGPRVDGDVAKNRELTLRQISEAIKYLQSFASLRDCDGGSGCQPIDWPAQVRRLLQRLPPEYGTRISPTVEVYAFYDTGGFHLSKAGRHALLHPLTSYGLHLYQDGALEGWRQVIDGAEQLGANLYRIRVGPDGRTVINNRTQAVAKGEKPVEPDPQWKPTWIPLGEGDDIGGCEDSATNTKAGLLGMLALWLVTAVGLRRVSRRRPPSP